MWLGESKYGFKGADGWRNLRRRAWGSEGWQIPDSPELQTSRKRASNG